MIILFGQVLWQVRRIEPLKVEVAFNQRHLDDLAGKLAEERLQARREDVVSATRWLHAFYASDEGLRRQDGLWLPQQHQPDFEAIGAWIFDVYLSARVHGASDADARRAIVDGIRSTDEWRRVHAPR